MNKTPEWLDSFLRNKYLHGGAAFLTIVTIGADAFGPLLKLSHPVSILIFTVMVISIAVFIIMVVYSLRFRGDIHRLTEQVTSLSAENQRLKECATFIHKLNHGYRDVLHDVFGPTNCSDSKEVIEQKTLKAACERIAEMFSSLIGEKCTVTVKLMTKHEGDKDKCHTLARSESNSERDRTLVNYELDTGKNAAFDTARRYNFYGPSFFFSPDLVKDFEEGKYQNERLDWRRFYKSAIVVPIRYVNYQEVGSHSALNELGFLAIDTMGINKLNGSSHVQYMAAFADQMYNFMSLMRGKYCLSLGGLDTTRSLMA